MAALGEPPGQRIRVLRVAGRLNRGGPTRQALALCRDLPPQRFETLLAFGEVASGEEEDLQAFFDAKIFLERIPSLRRGFHPLRDITALWKLRKLIRRERPRILHTHLAKAGALGRTAAALADVPIRVHTFHGTNFEGHFSPLLSRLSVFFERRFAKRCQALVAVSEAVRQDLLARRIAPPEKIVVIPPGLDLEPYLAIDGASGKLREAMNIGPEVPLIGFVGRLVPVKDPLEFVEAAAAISIAKPDARFVVLGDGPLRAAMLAEVEALDLRSRFYFAGWRADMPACLADLDLVLATSRSEGMPVSLIEAMAANRFVVARGVGGIPELLGNGRFGAVASRATGADASGDSVEELALRWLADAAARREIAAAAREQARARYSASRLVGDMAQLYELLLSGQSLSQFHSSACR